MKNQPNKKFFWRDVDGVNADIQRHRNEEIKIRENIAEIEKEVESESKQRKLRVYRNFLNILLSSKAEVVSKIGNKKH